MRTRGKHVLHRRELFRDEACDLAHRAVLDNDGQIKAAGHQVDALHLMVGVDLAGDFVKAHAFCGVILTSMSAVTLSFAVLSQSITVL